MHKYSLWKQSTISYLLRKCWPGGVANTDVDAGAGVDDGDGMNADAVVEAESDEKSGDYGVS